MGVKKPNKEQVDAPAEETAAAPSHDLLLLRVADALLAAMLETSLLHGLPLYTRMVTLRQEVKAALGGTE